MKKNHIKLGLTFMVTVMLIVEPVITHAVVVNVNRAGSGRAVYRSAPVNRSAPVYRNAAPVYRNNAYVRGVYYRNGVRYNYFYNGQYYKNCKLVPAHQSRGISYPAQRVCW